MAILLKIQVSWNYTQYRLVNCQSTRRDMPGGLYRKTAISLNGTNRLVLVMKTQSVVGETGTEFLNIISIKYGVSSFCVEMPLSCLRNSYPVLKHEKVHYPADSSPRGFLFLGVVLLAFRPTPRAVDHSLSAVHIFRSSSLSAI